MLQSRIVTIGLFEVYDEATKKYVESEEKVWKQSTSNGDWFFAFSTSAGKDADGVVEAGHRDWAWARNEDDKAVLEATKVGDKIRLWDRK